MSESSSVCRDAMPFRLIYELSLMQLELAVDLKRETMLLAKEKGRKQYIDPSDKYATTQHSLLADTICKHWCNNMTGFYELFLKEYKSTLSTEVHTKWREGLVNLKRKGVAKLTDLTDLLPDEKGFITTSNKKQHIQEPPIGFLTPITTRHHNIPLSPDVTSLITNSTVSRGSPVLNEKSTTHHSNSSKTMTPEKQNNEMVTYPTPECNTRFRSRRRDNDTMTPIVKKRARKLFYEE